MIRPRPFFQILVTRLKEAFREPEVLFWVFLFPVLLALALGVAFRNRPPEKILVAVEAGAQAEETAETLNRAAQFQADVLPPAECASRLRLGKVALVIAASGESTSSSDRAAVAEVDSRIYRYDPTRPDSALARALVDDLLQRAAGRKDAVLTTEEQVTEPGARYVDFLIPGLIGMNVMSGGMWGLGFVIVDMRTRKLLKRLVATPMRRSEFLAAMMASRVIFMLIEVVLLLVFGWIAFDMLIRGSLVTTVLIGLVGALCFGAMGVLVASRARKIETVSGLMNLVMLPMYIFSGIFFSSDRFPDVLQPLIKALPLTALNDALRAVILEGADLASQVGRLAFLGMWGAACFALSIRWFRWS